MRENIKISKIDKKIKKLLKKMFLLKKFAIVLSLSDRCLKMKVHKMLERQKNVYIPSFV